MTSRQSHDPIRLERNVSKTAEYAITTIALLDSLLWGSTVGYPSDSLASCFYLATYTMHLTKTKITDLQKFVFVFGTEDDIVLLWAENV